MGGQCLSGRALQGVRVSRMHGARAVALLLLLSMCIGARHTKDSWEEPPELVPDRAASASSLVQPMPDSSDQTSRLTESVYKTKTSLAMDLGPSQMVQALEFIGCFKDKPASRAMATRIGGDVVSTADCVSGCKKGGHLFMGRQSTGQCWCGSNWDKYGSSDQCNCDADLATGNATGNSTGNATGNSTGNLGVNVNCVYKLPHGFECSMPGGCNLLVEYPEQKKALLILHSATNGQDWSIPPGFEWDAKTDMCTWAGVACDPWGRVVKLSLPGYGLSGALPQAIAQLTSLTFLDLSSNMLDGTVPTFQSASNLTYLYLNRNKFSGDLQPSLATSQLRHLELSSNGLTGEVPAQFARMTSIEFLDLSDNKFTQLPPQLSALLSKLQSTAKLGRQCNLGQNKFNCPIPEVAKYPSPCAAICGTWI